MKKIYNLFRWVMCVNLIAMLVPWVAWAEEVPVEMDVGVVEEIDNIEDEDDEKENDGEVNEDGVGGEDEAVLDLPILYIRAVSYGFDAVVESEFGDMVVIGKNSEDLVSLAGVTVRYTNGSGNPVDLIKFPENSYMAGENLVLRYGKSPQSELSNSTYATPLALKAGPVALVVEEEGEEVVIDESACWNGKVVCNKFAFNKAAPAVLVRNLETGEFEWDEEFEVDFDAESLVIAEPEVERVENEKEEGGRDEESNDDKEDGEKKSSEELQDEIFEDEKLNEKPDDNAKIEDLTGAGKVKDEAETPVTAEKVCEEGKYLNPLTGRCKKIEAETVKTCEEGYYLNEETGRCRKIVVEEEKVCAEGYYLYEPTGRCRKIVVEEVKVCQEGYYLYEPTGRCRKIVVEEEKTCAEGQYLNPLTGRCRKIEVETVKVCQDGYYLYEPTGRCRKIVVEEEKTCDEGYYLNEETGRCRKIVENNGAEYELTAETYEEKSSFAALYAIVGVVGVGMLYVIWEFRKEIGRFFKRLFRR